MKPLTSLNLPSPQTPQIRLKCKQTILKTYEIGLHHEMHLRFIPCRKRKRMQNTQTSTTVYEYAMYSEVNIKAKKSKRKRGSELN